MVGLQSRDIRTYWSTTIQSTDSVLCTNICPSSHIDDRRQHLKYGLAISFCALDHTIYRRHQPVRTLLVTSTNRSTSAFLRATATCGLSQHTANGDAAYLGRPICRRALQRENTRKRTSMHVHADSSRSLVSGVQMYRPVM